MHEKMNPTLVGNNHYLAISNFREFVAAGIREKAFDEAMFKRIQEYQWLAERWIADPLQL